MKVVFGTLLLLLSCCLIVAREAQQKNKGEEKSGELSFDDSYLQKLWGVKCKTIVIDKKGFKIKLLLVFTEDVDDVKGLKDALTPPGRDKFTKSTVEYHYFDAANVSLGKRYSTDMQGELTGEKGDAFWITVSYHSQDLNAVRLAVRPPEGAKKKKAEPEKK
jgi:hypothetical protein